MGSRTGLNDVKKRKILTLPGLELRFLIRPARRQSLYRLRYPEFRIGRIRVRTKIKSNEFYFRPSLHTNFHNNHSQKFQK
jgi:hypothetical protein